MSNTTIRDDIETILSVLMDEGIDRPEAIKVFKDMRNEVREGADPEELLYDIGLEPDYIFALIP